MAKITRIKAGESSKKASQEPLEAPVKKKVHIDGSRSKKALKAAKKAEKHALRAEKKAKKVEKRAKKAEIRAKKRQNEKKIVKIIKAPFRGIAWVFCAIGRYFRDSWLELRQVRWPSRRATWKIFLAIVIYAALIMVLILLLDVLFTYLFNSILG